VRFPDGRRETATVPQGELQAYLGKILAAGSVADITVEDPPLEEVMRELFTPHPPKSKDLAAS